MAAQAGTVGMEKRKKESTSMKEKHKKDSTSMKEKRKKESTSKKEKRSGKAMTEDMAKAKAAKISDTEIGVCCYAIIPVTDLRKAVGDALPARTRALWEERRIDAWRHCAAFLEKRAWFRFQLTHLIWNERVMVAVVKGLEFDEKEVKNAKLDAEKGKQFVDELPEWVHDSLHVRLVISGDDVEPKEARYLVRHWKRNRGDVQGEMRGLKGRVYKLEYLRQLGRVTSPSYAYDLDFDDRPRDRSRLYSRN
ncbi:hypothetical protein WOLCODRAFT_145090 [Wolfiporia cocos MD-104 SS10]|uniref:tRNA ligase phosphodiesterase domain-containing protein n=1 Tax=Wolfiporia cocos (strain MD-104) TaxID=742152 RepID=A0A2H3K863_WOLCO|nr:hypothetical protein WOLCODRAFT_145090 [Wolfiporia cocos MD-104 SS10]